MKNEQKTCPLLNRMVAFLATIICLTIISGPVIAADNYLDELSAESDSTAQVSSSTQKDSAYYNGLGEMEILLKRENPATYDFYAKLHKVNKERIYKIYTTNIEKQTKQPLNFFTQVMDLYLEQ